MHRRFDWQYIYIYKKTRWFRTPFPTWQDQFSQKESGDSISKVQTFQKTQPPQFPQRRIGHPPRNPPIFPRQTEGNMSQGLQGVHLPLFFTIFRPLLLLFKTGVFTPLGWEVVGAEPKLNGKRWLFTNSSLLPGSFIQDSLVQDPFSDTARPI